MSLRCMLAAFGIWLGAWTATASAEAVIGPGREAEVEGLFAPHRLGAEVPAGSGRYFVSIAIEIDTIELGIGPTPTSPADERLVLTRRIQLGESASFSVDRETDSASADALVDALVANDDGTFWDRAFVPTPNRGGHAGRDRATLAVWVGWVPWTHPVFGVVALLAALLLILLLTWRAFGILHPNRPRVRMAMSVLAVVVASGFVRWAISPRSMLGAWVWTRNTELQRWVWDSDAFTRLNDWWGGSWLLVDTWTGVGFACALLTPLAVYAHGALLLGTHQRGLWVAAFVAASPIHMRFSASEVAFIPSILFSSTFFAAMHIALKDQSRWRFVGLAALPPLSLLVVTARPLNFLFAFLMVGWLVFAYRRPEPNAGSSTTPTDSTDSTATPTESTATPTESTASGSNGAAVPSPARRWLVGLIVAIPSAAGAYVHLSESYGSQVQQGASLDTLWRAIPALFSPKANTLLDASVTPLAMLFFVALAFRSWKKERARLAFLVVWFLVFFGTHAFVIVESVLIQTRYQLHLVVPIAMLAALGMTNAWNASQPRPGRWPWQRGVVLVLCGWVGLGPVLHAAFVTDLSSNDIQEFEFVRASSELVPDGCEVLEVAALEMGARYGRFASVVRDGRRTERFGSTRLSPGDEVPARTNPCLFLYEGLLCQTLADPDGGLAQTCGSVLRSARWQRVAETEFESRVGDHNLATRADLPDRVRLTLYRAEPDREPDSRTEPRDGAP